jgi:hypothetical protein
MAAPDRINATLAAQDIADLNAAATTLETKLAFMIGLSPEERQAIPKMGVNGNDFVRDVLTAAEQNPALIPAAIDLAGARRDYNLVNDLTPIASRLQRLLEGLNDTILEAGSEAFVTSLEAYDILKRLGKGTNLDESLKKMSRRFAKQPRQPKTPVEGEQAA